MGMYDTFINRLGNEWQTKAMGRGMGHFRIGDQIPGCSLASFQVEVVSDAVESDGWLATVRGGQLVEVPAYRDQSLPYVGFHGEIEDAAEEGPLYLCESSMEAAACLDCGSLLSSFSAGWYHLDESKRDHDPRVDDATVLEGRPATLAIRDAFRGLRALKQG